LLTNRQLLTVWGVRRAIRAVAPVPPSASMTSDAVRGVRSITHQFTPMSKSRQYKKLWLSMEPELSIVPPDMDGGPADKLEVAQRLRNTRIAFKLTQTRLCGLMGIAIATWNNAETGHARIGVDTAIQFCNVTGVTLDWIYRGIKLGLPHGLVEALIQIEANPPPKRKK
jgi:DNA-binding XRE family transcriptional regulator